MQTAQPVVPCCLGPVFLGAYELNGPRASHRRVSIWGATLLLAAGQRLDGDGSVQAAQSFRRRRSATNTRSRAASTSGSPRLNLTIASGGSGALAGIPGTEINAKRDLGLVDKKPAAAESGAQGAVGATSCASSSCRSSYEQAAILSRQIDFNGQRYTVGLPVNSTVNWKALRLGYEHDIVVKSRGYGGFIIEDKQTDVRVDIATPLIKPQFAHAQRADSGAGRRSRVSGSCRASTSPPK